MAGYVSEFATGAAIEAILKKANNSQSVSQSEKTTWNNKQNKITFTELWSSAEGCTIGTDYTLSDNINNYSIIFIKISTPVDVENNYGYCWIVYVPSVVTAGEPTAWNGYNKRYICMTLNGTTFNAFRNGADGEGNSSKPYVYAIYGLK